MARVEHITSNFTAGVWSPRLRGRVDLDKYNSSLRDGENAVVLKHGGVTARPPLDYIGTISEPGSQARIVPFVYDNDNSYIIEFGGTNIKVWKDGALVGPDVAIVNPYISTRLFEFDYVQSGDTLILAHQDLTLRRLRRFSDSNWTLDEVPLNPGPMAEIGNRANIAITLSAATVGTGRTATADSDFFRQADVGRSLTYQGGIAVVTAYTSTSVVEVEITRAFPTTGLNGNTWLLEGSPQVALTPSAKDPVGQTITLTGTATAFRTEDAGAYISINGGLVRLTGVDGVASDTDTHDGDGATTTFAYTFQILHADEIEVTVGGVVQTRDIGLGGDYTVTGVGSTGGGTVVFTVAPPVGTGNIVFTRDAGDPSIGTGVIVQELTSTTAAPADAWVLRHSIWNAVDEYPSCVTFHEQRLWAGNTPRFPKSMWGSRSGLPFDFTPGSDDDHAVAKTADSAQANPIRFMHSGRQMALLTDSTELEMRGGVEKPITQTNAAIRKQSKWGCAHVKPEEAGESLIFAQRGAKVLRAIYSLEIEGFSAKDIGVYAEHMLQAGVAGMTFQQTPESVLWVWLTDGSFVAATYDAEQNVIAMVPCSTGTAGAPGYVESMCTVPEGDADMTYAIVRREINGSTTRYLERFNWDANPGMDSRATGTGGPTTWAGFSHLTGETVTVLMDGVADGESAVAAGALTTSESATTVYAGLPYTPSITPQDPEVGTGSGTAQGQALSVHRIVARFQNTFGCNVNGEALRFERFGDDPLNPVNSLLTGDLDITDYGWSKDGSDPLTLTQPQPYPWTVLAVIRHLTVNPG